MENTIGERLLIVGGAVLALILALMAIFVG